MRSLGERGQVLHMSTPTFLHSESLAIYKQDSNPSSEKLTEPCQSSSGRRKMPTIAIRIEPEPKARPRFWAKNGRSGVYTPEQTRTYEQALQFVMKAQWQMKPLEGPLEVEVDFFFTRPKSGQRKAIKDHIKRPDLDNLMKAVFDAANGILWNDDCQVVRVTATKSYEDTGCIILQVKRALA